MRSPLDQRARQVEALKEAVGGTSDTILSYLI